MSNDPARRVGFVSFRLAGTDGVSLETFKWAQVFERLGFPCYYFGGELEAPPERSMLVEEAHLQHPEVRRIYEACFARDNRDPETTAAIHRSRERLKLRLHEFIRRFKIDVLVPENALTIPLNIPLGLAITEVISETGIPTIAHHHDFYWERQRFLHNCVWDYLRAVYPPRTGSIHHVVINSSGRNQLALRTGATATLIPNVMDFEKGPASPDGYAKDVRTALGIGPDEVFVLQPTRVVQRKGIEHAIELVRRLDMDAVLVISHASGDEGYEYEARVRKYAELLGVKSLFISQIIDATRGTTPDGRKIYALDDVYPHADLVTYPSIFEGFGNAFLEAVFHRTPIVVNNYSIYSYDIKPRGFRTVEMEDYVTDSTVTLARRFLSDSTFRAEAAEHNYQLGRRYFSYEILANSLLHIIQSFWGQSV